MIGGTIVRIDELISDNDPYLCYHFCLCSSFHVSVAFSSSCGSHVHTGDGACTGAPSILHAIYQNGISMARRASAEVRISGQPITAANCSASYHDTGGSYAGGIGMVMYCRHMSTNGGNSGVDDANCDMMYACNAAGSANVLL